MTRPERTVEMIKNGQVWIWLWDEVHPSPGELNPEGKTADEVSDTGRWEMRGTGASWS